MEQDIFSFFFLDSYSYSCDWIIIVFYSILSIYIVHIIYIIYIYFLLLFSVKKLRNKNLVIKAVL